MEGKNNCDEAVKTHLNFSVENILKENFQKRRAFSPVSDQPKSPKEAKYISKKIHILILNFYQKGV